MVSTLGLPSTPYSQTCYKNSSESTLLGFLPPQDRVTQTNDHHHDMQHSFRTWLVQDDYLSPFSTNFGESDDLAVPEITDFDCHSTYYSVPVEVGDQHDQYLSAWPEECKVYTNYCSSGHGDYLGESGFGVGHYQIFENKVDGNTSSLSENYVSPIDHGCAPTNFDSWGARVGKLSFPTSGENNAKVGRYSVEERRERILRYLNKRNQRNFNKTIKYACRKALADRRIRIHGRFAKNHEDDQPSINNKSSPQEENIPCVNAAKNEEYYEDEWLQQAMASLMSVPSTPK